MLSYIILTIISDDKPGVVEAIAHTVSEHNGNWLESSLAQLSGKFAGVVRASVSSDRKSALIAQLEALSSQDIHISIELNSNTPPQNKTGTHASFHALGPDRPGIVRDISHAFSEKNINVETLTTGISSMPYSGEPLFEASGKLSLPDSIDIDDIQESLDEIGDELALHISVKAITADAE
ncbi:MAG: cellulose-binding protein [Alteromonadaceae bacterium]|nr:MAG: cellulose-binding protein [Alteromonadaceae bacterium]